jgi:hypothetical protein
MTNLTLMELSNIQPSQLYISSRKLRSVMKDFASKPSLMEPIPVKKLGDKIIFVDGHTRALAALLHRFSSVPVYWEDEDLDWEAYEICVRWCLEDGILTIADLKNRVISHREYKKLWYERCANMQKELESKRKARRESRKARAKKWVARGQGIALPNRLDANLMFKAKVVELVLSKDTEEALQLLSQHYEVAKPNLKVGMPKRYSKNPACYIAKKRTIHVSNREVLRNPRVVLHEFYHHLRNLKDAHGGIEKYAQRFAENYLQAYRIILACIPPQRIEHNNEK